MTTGTQSDIQSRLQSYLPRGWFGDFSQAPIINGVLAGISSTLAITYALIMFMWAQTRLTTSSGGWVDMWAADFLGTSLPRNTGEGDISYIARIQANLFQQKSTRQGMINTLTALTGRAPVIFEPMNPIDSGCLGKNTGVASFFGVARFGSLACPYGALIIAYRPKNTLLGAGYFDAPAWTAFNTRVSNGYFGRLAGAGARDYDIYAAVNNCRPVCSNIGLAISS